MSARNQTSGIEEGKSVKNYRVWIMIEGPIEAEDVSEVLPKFLNQINVDPSLVTQHEIGEVDEFGFKVRVDKGYKAV